MKKLLWRPNRISWQIHVLIAIVAIIGLAMVETIKVNVRQPWYKQKIAAANYMKKGMNILKKYRLREIGPVDTSADPANSGLIGELATKITTKEADYDAKLTSINPNWAAVIVLMLKQADVKNGSTIAVTYTSSYPALNLAVISAAKALQLKVIPVSSISSSSWGANIPGFTWLDMEKVLYRNGFISYRSAAASLGGINDIALGIPESAKAMLKKTIIQHNIPFLQFGDVKESIDARMELYQEKTAESGIAAFINVGGGITAVGSLEGKWQFKPGLNLKPPRKTYFVDSIMSRFARQGVPVIYLINVKTLARHYGLEISPQKTPKIGTGDIYSRLEYNRFLVIGVLASIIALLYIFIRLGIGYRIFSIRKKDNGAGTMEHMV